MSERGLRASLTGPVHRREVLAAVGTAGLVTGASTAASGTGSPSGEATLQVRLYPGPVPPWVWLRYGPRGLQQGMPAPFRAARSAVGVALEAVAGHAGDRLDRSVTASVSVAAPLSSSALGGRHPTRTRGGLLEAFRSAIADTAPEGPICHLLLWWGPSHARVGYGGTSGTVADDLEHGAQGVINVGATEFWDTRSVTEAMAIHEVLHAYLDTPDTEAVAGTNCDHDLGAVSRTGATLTVSPLATAYAGPRRLGTRWPGSGCLTSADPAASDDVDQVTHTKTPSDPTLAGITHFLERTGLA